MHFLSFEYTFDGRGATTAEKLRGLRFGSHAGALAPRARPKAGLGVGCMREGFTFSAVRVRGYHPRKIFFENSDVKSCILHGTCCEISCFLKTTAKKSGDQYIVGSPDLKVGGPVSPVPMVVAPMFDGHRSHFFVPTCVPRVHARLHSVDVILRTLFRI